jgi:hypothetical protein
MLLLLLLLLSPIPSAFTPATMVAGHAAAAALAAFSLPRHLLSLSLTASDLGSQYPLLPPPPEPFPLLPLEQQQWPSALLTGYRNVPYFPETISLRSSIEAPWQLLGLLQLLL